jgi:hypothetical protein
MPQYQRLCNQQGKAGCSPETADTPSAATISTARARTILDPRAMVRVHALLACLKVDEDPVGGADDGQKRADDQETTD